VASEVFPFRTNSYVVEELIDWSRGFEDPLLRLSFPHREMLGDQEFGEMADALRRGAALSEREAIASRIRRSLNPHPTGQLTVNVPLLRGRPVPGVQHKYRETVLVFPIESRGVV
jgi:L-lysine 2,3-aminomutase